jgi:hypothetical protein
MASASSAPVRGAGLGALRGLVTGGVAGIGALIAHLAAGGSVAVMPGLMVGLIILPVAVATARSDRAALPRITLVAVLAQAVGHYSLTMAPATPDHGHHVAGTTLLMLALHAAVAAATILVALGFDRALVELARATLSRLFAMPALLGVAVPAARQTAVGRALVLRERLTSGRVGARAPPGLLTPSLLTAPR